MNLNNSLNAQQLAALLELDDFSKVYAEADRIRHETVGDAVQIRAILEFSNHCRRRCRYCGLGASNSRLKRFRMQPEEMVTAAQQAANAGYRTLVMQSGEDPVFTPTLLGEIIREIKKTGMAITVSCGEMNHDALAHLRQCGADRYLLKHETADSALYAALHPCGTLASRIECLRNIKKLGYETGSGFMIGLPNQTVHTIAQDILLLKELECDMAGIGPFIAHPDTPLHAQPNGSTERTKRAVALTRILLPKANLPATTSLGVIDGEEKNDVFSCGANVIMRKITPDPYKSLYEIYPSQMGKTDVRAERLQLEKQIRALGKTPM